MFKEKMWNKNLEYKNITFRENTVFRSNNKSYLKSLLSEFILNELLIKLILISPNFFILDFRSVPAKVFSKSFLCLAVGL